MFCALKEPTDEQAPVPASVSTVIKVQTENQGSMKKEDGSDDAQNLCIIKMSETHKSNR